MAIKLFFACLSGKYSRKFLFCMQCGWLCNFLWLVLTRALPKMSEGYYNVYFTGFFAHFTAKGFYGNLPISAKNVMYKIDPLGQTTVMAGRDHCFRTCCPSVSDHISNLGKHNNRKQCSLLRVWPSESLMTPVLYNLYQLKALLP